MYASTVSSDGFKELDGLVLKAGETKYPQEISVEIYGKKSKLKIGGIYNQTEGKSFGRPVYENKNGTIFFNGILP